MEWSKKQANIENIKSWCEKIGIEDYTINSKDEIDVNGDVDLNNKDFEEIPYKFGRVNGYFSLSRNKDLMSLKNCPNYIIGNNMFDVDDCPRLDSLEGCPKQKFG